MTTLFSPAQAAILLSMLAVTFSLLSVFVRMRTRKRDQTLYVVYRNNHQMVTPELNAAIDLMYKGKIKEARTILCRLRNSIQQPK